MTKVLITGISGQDGLFLTSKLIKTYNDVEIIGISRNSKKNFLKNLSLLNNNFDEAKIKILNIDLLSFNDVLQLVKNFKPTSVYNLSGPSSVRKSLEENKEYKNTIIKIFDNLINSLLETHNKCNFFQASSSEFFSKNNTRKLTEKSLIEPRNPYSEAKAINHFRCITLSEKYNWNIVSGILFNHESEFRKDNFLIMKIINSAFDIKNNQKNKLVLGSLNYVRDWTYAEDTVNAIFNITENWKNNSYVIGSGNGTSIEFIVNYVFSSLELDTKNKIVIDEKYIRKSDPISIISNPYQLKNDYDWIVTYKIEQLLDKIIDYKKRTN